MRSVLSSLSGWWDLAKMDAAYDAAGFMGEGYPGSPSPRPRSAVYYFVVSLSRLLACRLFGHVLSSELEAGDAECGGEEISCSRCGWSVHLYHG